MKRTMSLVLFVGLVCTAGVMAWGWPEYADPFCWRGYIAPDGRCAWE